MSGGLVPVSKRWVFEESGENAAAANELRRLLDQSGFWSHPADGSPCHPDQQRLFLRVKDYERTREISLPAAGCDENMRALGEYVSARVTWSPKNTA